MVRWHLSGHKSEQTPGDGEGQGTLAHCGPRGCKESDTTERLETITMYLVFFFFLSEVSGVKHQGPK